MEKCINLDYSKWLKKDRTHFGIDLCSNKCSKKYVPQ